METDGINALNPAPDVGGILPPQINRPGPVIDYLTRPMVPSPASRRRDTLKGIAQFLPFISGELAKAEGDMLGVALAPLDALGAASAPAKAVAKKGILSLNKVYHGSPNENLTEASISKSKQSENFMPHVSATDSPLLAKSFTKGELGNLPEGKIYESVGDFKIIDYTTDEGRKIWDSLGKTDYDRSINAKKAGFDGRKINNYEKLKIDNFYPDIDYKDVKDASEIQFFKDLPLQPFTKGIQSLGKKVEKPKKVKKLKPKETEQLFSGIESTKRESLDAPYKNPIIDLVNERPELTQLSKSALDPNEDGVVSLFRVYNLKEGQELLPEKGIASLSTDVAPALEIGQKMEFIRGGGFNPMSLGPETPEFTIKRPAKLIRYEVPIDRVKAHVPSLLDQVPARAANAEKNSKFMSASSEKEVLADLSGIQPAEIFDVPFRAGARYFAGSVPAYRPSPYDIEKGADPTRVLNYGLFRLFEEGRTPKGLMRDIMKSGSPKFRREPKSAYMSYKNYLAKVAADEADPSRRPASFSGDQKTYAELNPGVSPYQMYGPDAFPMPIASRPRAKQDYQDLLDAFEEYKKIKGIGSL
jgi:hypothetical protein